MKSNDRLAKPADSSEIITLSIEDEKLKILGDLLSNDTSRKILKLLYGNEMAATEIAQKTESSLSLILHHLKKMQEVDIVRVNKVEKNSREHDVKYYVVAKFAMIILFPDISEKAKRSKSLLNSLRRIQRFAAIGITAAFSWIVSQYLQIGAPSSAGERLPVGVNANATNLWPVIISLIIVISGLILDRLLVEYRKVSPISANSVSDDRFP
ncbi:MAG: winged helix-turn-helix transcriptional regulator [Thaumarchaeota archaeon]|nr:winged helix-turn-helix transcriptional regulator [Nitrososphaerota archaeon]